MSGIEDAQESRGNEGEPVELKGTETPEEVASAETPVEPPIEADQTIADADLSAPDANPPAETTTPAEGHGDSDVKDVQPMDAKGVESQTPMAMVVEEAVVDPKTPSKNRRAKTHSKVPSLEAAVARVKVLTEEVDKADAAIADEVKNLEAWRSKIVEVEAGIANMRTAADAKRAAVQRAKQEYLRQQCQVAIAHLESCIPKKPLTAFFMFRADNCVKGMPTDKQSKLISEKWTNATEEQKQKYNDRYAAELKRYREWSASEEGQKNLRERNELIRQCKTTNQEELDKAVVAEAEQAPNSSQAMSVKRAKKAVEKGESPETPAKQRRVVAAKSVPSTKGSFLDEQVLEAAGKLGLVSQLQNLASRPDVLSLGKTAQELLDVLRAKSGMVNAAKHALLSV